MKPVQRRFSLGVFLGVLLILGGSLLVGWEGGAGKLTFQDEGVSQGTAATANFTGAGVTASVAGSVVTVNVPGGGGSASDASSTVKGISKLSLNPVLATDPIAVGDNDGRMTNARTPTAHAPTHQQGSTDVVNVGGLAGALADPQKAKITVGVNTGVISADAFAEYEVVQGTDGILYRSGRNPTVWVKIAVKKYADLDNIPATFTPATHAPSHQLAGSDPVNVGGLAGTLADSQNTSVTDETTELGQAKHYKFTGAGVTASLASGVATIDVPTGGGSGEPPIGLYSNLKVEYATTNSVTVTADALVVDNGTNVKTLRNVSVAPDIAVNGANGLDTGSEADSTWYSIWVIWNGTTAAGLLSTSTSAPTLPSGYTYKFRAGWVRNDAGPNFTRFTKYGNTVFQGPTNTVTSRLVFNVNSNINTDVSCSNLCPPTARVVLLTTYIGSSQGAVDIVVYLVDKRTGNDVAITSFKWDSMLGYSQGQVEVPLDATRTFQYRVANSAATLVSLYVAGYRE